MTYWVDTADHWAADATLAAYITVHSVQGNLKTTYEQSGSDLDGALLYLSGGYYAETPGATWAWTGLVPMPIRIRREIGASTWCDLTIEILGELDGAGDVDIRAFILPFSEHYDVDSATGTVSDFDYCTMNFTLAAQARKSGTLTPSRIGMSTLEGIDFRFAWLRFAATGDGSELRIYSIRIKEVPA